MTAHERRDIDLATAAEQSSEEDEAQEGNVLAEQIHSADAAEHTAVHVVEDDADGDGLNNSWEKSYESDPGNADTDGDGMLDGDEHLAGTSPTDEGSEFVVARISRGRLSWKSALGRRYQIQRADAAGGEYVNIGDVVDADPVLDETEIDIPDGAGSGMGFYRVKLVIE